MQDPVLQFKNDRGEAQAEYIPLETTWLDKWYYALRQKLALRFGWDTYWWHIDHMYPPQVRKRYDMHFLRHVDEAHGGQPEDTKEKRYYDKLMFLYKHEYEWAKQQAVLVRDMPESYDETVELPHMYSFTYLQRWFREEPIPEWVLLYHGVPAIDSMEMIRDDYDRRGWWKTNNE